MALADRLSVSAGRSCKFTRVYEVMSKEDQETLGQWIEKRLPQRTIVAATRRSTSKLFRRLDSSFASAKFCVDTSTSF